MSDSSSTDQTPQPRRPASDRKLAAARANGAKGKGKHTPAGKARSALNAITHGLTAQTNILPGEDAAAFLSLSERNVKRYQPMEVDEEFLVEYMTSKMWVLIRACGDQRNLMALGHVENADRTNSEDANVHQAMTAVHTALERAEILDKLSRYEHRHEKMLMSAMRKLQEVQTIRQNREIVQAAQAKKAAEEAATAEAAAKKAKEKSAGSFDSPQIPKTYHIPDNLRNIFPEYVHENPEEQNPPKPQAPEAPPSNF